MLTTKTVYSLYYPETRRIVDELWRERPHHLYERNYTKRQDAMHAPLLSRYRTWAADAGVTFGSALVHEYPTAGASEGIHALLARVASRATTGPRARVHVFDGEYEGYRHLAAALSLEVCTHARSPDRWTRTLKEQACAGDWLLISQPSAIDGCVWDGYDELVAWARTNVPELAFAVDLTYVGAVARPFRIDVSPSNVAVVLASLSKPFGVYYHRIGALFSRTPFDSLYGNLWFKNLFSLALGERLLAAFGARDLPSRYAPLQKRALERAVAAGEAPASAEPSDVVLLAHARVSAGDALAPELEAFVRSREHDGLGLRWCLTPALDALVAEGAR